MVAELAAWQAIENSGVTPQVCLRENSYSFVYKPSDLSGVDTRLLGQAKIGSGSSVDYPNSSVDCIMEEFQKTA